MPEFRQQKSGPSISSATVHVHHQKTVFFAAEWQDITPVADAKLLTIMAHPQPRHKGDSLQFWQLTVSGNSPGVGVIQINPGPRESGATAAARKIRPQPAKLDVTIVKELLLPDANSDAGIMARVFLHETLTPAFVNRYDPQNDAAVMSYMRNVLENRRFRRFDLFGFKSSPSLLQLIHNKTQFAGLYTYPHIPAVQMVNVNTSLTIANSDTEPRQPQFAKHVENAISIATRLIANPDPTENGLYSWRTAGHEDPGGYLVKYATLGGITFYTLSADTPEPIHGAKW